MACKKVFRANNKQLAKLADKQAPCAFCRRMVDEETTYGKLYSIGDIYCHYFCVLLSCCLIQKGKDEEGLFGFLYPDILAEIERSKKHKCSYCSRDGATLGCSVSQCRKQFHLPCGREKDAVSLFYGNYKSFCKDHAPKQKISDDIMSKANERMAKLRKNKREKTKRNLKQIKKEPQFDEEIPKDSVLDYYSDSVCVICYEVVEGFPTNQTFWPPCCGRDAWFHRSCLERMALSAGVHYLKCPLCNNKEDFYKAVLTQGYYIPDRDAAWELEQNAFSDIYQRPVVCTVEECKCPRGREYDSDSGSWDIKLCPLCGGAGAHAACAGPSVCAACAPAAPAAAALAALRELPLPTQDQRSVRQRSGPIMPSRMSLRRTKARALYTSSTSQDVVVKKEPVDEESSTSEARRELNLKPLKRKLPESSTQKVENKLLSPIKLLEKALFEKISKSNVEFDQNLLNEMQDKFKRPKPLVAKKKIVNEILERFLNNVSKENVKVKEPAKEWHSPKKYSNDDEGNIEEETRNIEEKEIKVENEEMKENVEISNFLSDDDSNSTFQLPSEFIADYNSDQSLPIFDTPKKLKKVNIQHDTMEISENDQMINIDFVKIDNDGSLNDLNNILPEKSEKCALKFSKYDKEVLDKNNLDIDVESFKNQYLNEVDRQFNCNLKHTENDQNKTNMSSTIDIVMGTFERAPKRESNSNVASKKRKATGILGKNKRKKNKHKTELSITNRNINLKIRFRDEGLKLKIKSKRKKKSAQPKKLKQYVLKCINDDKCNITRPVVDVMLKKKQRNKLKKTPDKLKQMSIDSFFKVEPNT